MYNSSHLAAGRPQGTQAVRDNVLNNEQHYFIVEPLSSTWEVEKVLTGGGKKIRHYLIGTLVTLLKIICKIPAVVNGIPVPSSPFNEMRKPITISNNPIHTVLDLYQGLFSIVLRFRFIPRPFDIQ